MRTQQKDEVGNLIAQVGLGDRTAFKDLYTRTSAKLYGISVRILANRSDAEDVLQETYIKVWHNAGSFNSNRARGITWLAAIARNQAIDRQRARTPIPQSDELVEEVTDPAQSPEAAAVRSDQVRLITECMEELQDSHAAALRSTYLAGWTYQQAADALDVPINTVKTWIRRSLVALRECMNR